MTDSRRPCALLVGAGGVIGRHVAVMLAAEGYDVITAGLDNADLVFDLCDPDATDRALAEAGPLDALICTAGRANFAPLGGIEAAPLETSVYGLGLKDKLMGQVNLALACRRQQPALASITLTSGTTSDDPIIGGSSLSMVNGALEAWVRAAAGEWPTLTRLNLVSPSLVEGTPAPAVKAFPGWEIISGARVAAAYLRCLRSGLRGQVIRV